MGFVPSGAQNIERGKGFVAFEKNGIDRIKFTSHKTLKQQVAAATRYANNNGGDLPNTAFWNKTADVYDDNVKLFKKEHQCAPLLALLRRDEAFDRANPVLPPATPIPAPISGGMVSPVVPGQLVEPQEIATNAIPEPASVLSLGLGMLVVFVVGRRRALNRSDTAR